MMFRLLIATLAIGATAFTPAATAGSRMSMSRVTPAAAFAPQPLTPEPRSTAIAMNADGEHETLYEMFDPGWAIITLAAYTGVLLKMGGVF
mmetsp:Transcript_84451/g.168654  ORF Transcript_84451/g.168654 Transcript_84451/m.168654 type:complete len:91 (-) Transcript_84451:293-565(-)